MSEKSKRKVNPRRRLLIRLIVGIAILAAVISAAIYTLQPKGAQIVFIASNDEGMDTIWIADLDNPEHPRQLVSLEVGASAMYDEIQIAPDAHLLIIQTAWSELGYWHEAHLMNIHTGQSDVILQCGYDVSGCGEILMRPDGRFIAYEQASTERTVENPLVDVMLYDVQTQTHQRIHEFVGDDEIYFSTSLQWVGKSGILFFRTAFESNEFIFYDAEDNRIIERRTLNNMHIVPTFSDDGLRYAYHERENPYADNTQIINLRHIDKPDEALISFDVNTDADTRTYIDVFGWHPNNVTVIVNEYRQQGDELAINQMNLYNTITGAKEILLDEDWAYYGYAGFNHDASQLLYWKTYRDGIRDDQIMLYDMENREIIPLPLFGRNPQWVNGGR